MEVLDGLVGSMKAKGSVLVAFSGGVDSTLVALAAGRGLGNRSLAVMFTNETVPVREVEDARRVASEVGIDFETVRVDVLSDQRFIENGDDRCAICHRLSVPALLRMAEERGFGTVADGANLDDLSDVRPGLGESDKFGIWHPLIEARIGKKLVRSILFEQGISVHSKPSSPCLASRIPHGQRVTEEKMRLVQEVESAIRSLGFEQVRLRLFEGKDGGLLGVVEVDDPSKAFSVWSGIKNTGNGLRMVLDPRGYRQGSLSMGD